MITPAPRPVLIVLPKRDFDPSEVAITWQMLRNAGNSLIFATPDGQPATADPLMLSGEGLDFWGRIPVLQKIKVLAARSQSARTGKSVLYGRKTTALTWRLEKAAWSTMKYFGRVWDPAYYRTYLEIGSEPLGYRSVQAEVGRALASPDDFCDVPREAADYFRKTSGLFRDSERDRRPAWVVRDRRYVSARWPGDVHGFAATFAAALAEFRASSPTG